MIILGENNDDKGTQLEKLTQRVLTDMRYQNVVLSEIRAGGAEIDVSADYITPIPGGQRTQKLLCECKAHKEPRSMTDWMKFLGKVYFEQTELNEDVLGCFISLSGVNGNVSGSYASYKRKKQNISILNQDDILRVIGSSNRLCDAQTVSHTVHGFTDRAFTSIEVAYYDHELYWLVTFDAGEYTLLTAQGDALIGDKQTRIRTLVETVTASNLFVDLFAEAEAQRRAVALQKALLAAFVSRGGSIPFMAAATQPDNDAAAPSANPVSGIQLNDFNRILRLLQDKGWVKVSDSGNELQLRRDDMGRCPDMADIFRFMLTGALPIEGLRDFIGSAYYDRHIDTTLVSEVLAIQGNIPLSDAQTEELLALMKLSPSALATFLYPVQFIAQHRLGTDSPQSPKIDADDTKTLFNNGYSLLEQDFHNPALAGYFYKIRGVREIESVQSLRVKSLSETILEGNLHSRTGIGIMGDTGRLIQLAIIGDENPFEDAGDPDQASIDAAYKALYTPKNPDALQASRES